MNGQAFPCSFGQTKFSRQIAINHTLVYVAMPVYLNNPSNEDFARNALQFSSKAVILILDQF